MLTNVSKVGFPALVNVYFYLFEHNHPRRHVDLINKLNFSNNTKI